METYETTRFGQIDVKDEDVITIPDGPLGFSDCTRWTFVDEDKAVPFRMLQSLDNMKLAFCVLDPLVARPDYAFNVTADDLKLIKATITQGLHVYCIVALSPKIEDVTINLQGPLVFNTINKLGAQFVLINSEYTTREKLHKPQEKGL